MARCKGGGAGAGCQQSLLSASNGKATRACRTGLGQTGLEVSSRSSIANASVRMKMYRQLLWSSLVAKICHVSDCGYNSTRPY